MPKRLIVCCDGTWNKPDQPSPTNVTKVALAVQLKDTAGIEQRTYYHSGVGTGMFDHVLGGITGLGLSHNIQDAYKFLIANYEQGDELFFFGFSRGAYTVRSTVGLIRNSGLLRREFANKLDDAYDLYRNRDDRFRPDSVEAELFRKSFSWEPRVKCLSVWDTVGALGIPIDGPLRLINKAFQFHDESLSRSVDNAFQALAVDERRKPFRPCVWKQHPQAGLQVLEQVWFAGVHSNVGGGYSDTSLSDIALLWMVRKAAGCGLALDLARIPAPAALNPLGKLENSMTLLYRLLGENIRKMGVVQGNCEFAGSSAITRLNAPASNYSPSNLRAYVAHNGPVSNVP